MEVELKLRTSAAGLEAVIAHGVLPPKMRDRKLVSTYFDTPDLVLRRSGVTLRVRGDGSGFTQTVKCRLSQDALRRNEVSTPVEGPEPNLEALSDLGARSHLRRIARNGLIRVFTTDVLRRCAEIEGSLDGLHSKIELALDEGRIDAGARSKEFAEIELELIEGSPATLFALAREVSRIAPVTLEFESKSERGYRLLTGEAARIHRSSAVDLEPNMPLGEAIESVFRNCFNHWVSNQAAVLETIDPEAIHQMRVGLRRFRSALAMFRFVLERNGARALNQSLARVLALLGQVRDRDVFLIEIAGPLAGNPDVDIEPLCRVVAAQRDFELEAARRFVEGVEYNGIVFDAGLWMERVRRETGISTQIAKQRSQRIQKFARRALDKRQQAVLKRGREFEGLSSEQRHQLRIAIKKLRYTSEFFSRLFNGKAQRLHTKALERMQEDLGHLNDIVVAEKVATAAIAAVPAKRRGDIRAADAYIRGWYASRVAVLEPKMIRDWKCFKGRRVYW